jgi:hypothetical protein
MIAHATQNRSHRSRPRGLQVVGATNPSAASDPSDAKEVTDTKTEL